MKSKIIMTMLLAGIFGQQLQCCFCGDGPDMGVDAHEVVLSDGRLEENHEHASCTCAMGSRSGARSMAADISDTSVQPGSGSGTFAWGLEVSKGLEVSNLCLYWGWDMEGYFKYINACFTNFIEEKIGR